MFPDDIEDKKGALRIGVRKPWDMLFVFRFFELNVDGTTRGVFWGFNPRTPLKRGPLGRHVQSVLKSAYYYNGVRLCCAIRRAELFSVFRVLAHWDHWSVFRKGKCVGEY